MRAIELVPQAPDVRVRVGRRLVVEKDDMALARNVLAPVLFSPHGGDSESLGQTAKLLAETAPHENVLEALDKAQWGEAGDCGAKLVSFRAGEAIRPPSEVPGRAEIGRANV